MQGQAKREKELFEELLSHTREMAKPINFGALQEQGILSKAGAWWRVHKMDELPAHAIKKIMQIKQDSKGVKVKFVNHERFARVARKFANR